MITYSEDQARACVPDAGTLQRGQQLAQPGKWAHLGRTDTAAWGECAGSGAKPYLTGIDLREPAFKCSCPSRVFPCKHGAGLLLLLARQAPLFGSPAPPAWLAEWLTKRQQPPAGKQTPAGPPTSAAAPLAAAGASAAPSAALAPARLARMAQGVAELETWLVDILRQGLATLDQQPARYWENQAARLVDNQLPGLAATVRELAALRHTHADWPARLLGRLGELYWLARAFQHREQLPIATRQQVLQEVGVSLKQEELPAHGAPVADDWRVLGQFSWEEDRLTARRSWLRGQASGRYALVLEFAFGGARFATPLLPHGLYAGALSFYPGPLPLRAAPNELTYAGAATPAQLPPAQLPGQLLDEYASALASQPWLREWPATLTGVVPVRQPDGRWLLHHPAEVGALPMRFANEDAPWQLLAQGGGQPLTLFGEWDGRAFRPLSSWLAPADALPDALRTTNQVTGSDPAAGRAGREPAEALAPAAEPTPPPGYPAFGQLLRLALLGTRQSGEVVPALPGLTTPADGPEQRLLLGAGTLALLHKAGFQPPASAVAPPVPAPAETGQPLGPLGTACLRELLAGNYSGFQADYWTQMAQHQRLIPAELLVAALRYAPFWRQLPGQLTALLGERGQWLAQQNPDWHSGLVVPDLAADPTSWETGSLPQRRVFLRQLHQADPERARELLAATLPTEPAATQATLLGELAPALTAADAPLLARYLAAKSKEVRQVVGPLLVRLPGAGLAERLWQRAAPLLTVKRPLLGRPTLQVTLPDGWDKTWLADGIEQKTTSFEGGERAGWLGQLLALLPPGRWASQLGVPPEELLALAEATEWKTLLLRAWARGAYLHQDQDFASRLLLRHFAQPQLLLPQQAAHLAELLPEAKKLALLRTQLPPQAGELPAFLPEFLQVISAPWPVDVVAAALRYVAEVLAPAVGPTPYGEAYQRFTALLQQLTQSVPAAELPRCRTVLEPLAVAQPVLAPVIEQLFDAVRFRQQLAASLTEPCSPSF